MMKLDKLIAYNSIDDIKDYYINNECDLIIAAYKDSIESIKNTNDKINIISMGEIINGLFEFWNDKELEYENILNLRKYLKEEKYINIVERFEKSIDSVYSSIKTCKELNIYPEDYEKVIETDEDIIFLNIMKKVYMEDTFIDYDIKLHNYKKNINLFKADFNNILSQTLNINLENKLKRIIIQGFYYITPSQRMIIELLRMCNIEIIPLICLNPQHKKVNEIVYKTFSNLHSIEKTYDLSNTKKDMSNIFADILDNKDIDSYKDEVEYNIEFNVYEDLNAYNKEILNSDEYIFATSRKNLINRISIFGGNLNNSKKIAIKYYPIGIFLKDIYKTWNKNRKDIFLEKEVLYRIFETNILKLENKNSRDYIYDLTLISNYFIDCKALKEWIDRAKTLKDNIVNCRYYKFKKHYAPFSIELTRLEDIIEYLNQIESITRILFNKDDYEIDMDMHLKNLQYIVEKNTHNTEDNDNLMAYELLKKIETILKTRQRKIRVNNTYLYDAISRYINTIEDEGELEVTIYPLDSIECAYRSDEEKIVITDFDRDNFPKAKRNETPWLSTSKLRKLLEYKEDEIEKDLIYRYLILIEDKDIISRYIFWLMLKVPKYKIVSRLKNNDRDTEHFYESILCDIGVNKKDRRFNNESSYRLESVDLNKYILPDNKQRDLKKEGQTLLFKYCPLRAFLYRMNLNKEMYTDDFRIEHYIPTLFADIVGKIESKQERKRELNKLLDLLPQYPKVIKSTMMYSTFKKCNQSQEEISLNSYINHDIDIDEEFKNLKEYVKSTEKINSDRVMEVICSSTIPIANSNNKTCKFCPNIDKCIAKTPPQINI